MQQDYLIGVLGGMGPEATVAFLQLLIAHTPAARDQDHLRVVLFSNPKIPDRTAAVLGTGRDPLPELLDSARFLERAGATLIVIPCNTAHRWLPQLRSEVGVPILDMVCETASTVRRELPDIKLVGLLATAGTVTARLYQQYLSPMRVEVVLPNQRQQRVIDGAIARVKAGDRSRRDEVLKVARGLQWMGAEAIIFGCTEIPLLLNYSELSCPIFDTLTILARQVVRCCAE